MCLHKVPRHLKVCRLLKGIGIIMIRFIFVVLFVVLFLILSTPLMLVEWIIGKFNPGLKDRSSLAIVNWAFRWVIRLSGTKVIAIGEENIPTDTAVLYVGNHRSFFDVVLTYVRVPRPTGYIAKKEMLKWPLLNIWMKDLHCLFLDRQDIKAGLKTILQAIEKAKNGISICIFPEGTRNKTQDTFLPFHEGSFKIAEKANVPIIPMTIVNTVSLFIRRNWTRRLARAWAPMYRILSPKLISKTKN